MRKLSVVGVAVSGLMAMAADAITTPGAGATTFGGTLQEPEITASPVSLTRPVVIGAAAGATFGAAP